MIEERKPETPGMSGVSANFVAGVDVAAGAPLSGAIMPDDPLTALAVDYYVAYIARDAATDAREEVAHQAEKSDSEAIRIEGVPTSGGPDRLFLPFLFDSAGTLTPSREQVSQYCQHSPSVADELTEAVMRHLEEYGERCVAALEAVGWPEKHAEHERAEQRMDTLFDQMVQTPAQGLRGIAAKIKGLVFPHEWEFLRDNELKDFGDQINTEMLVSLVADVERLAGEAVLGAGMAEDPVLVLKREWETRYKALDEHRDDPDADDSDKAVQPFYDRLDETEVQILRTPATTSAGIAVKLLLWARLQCSADEVSGLSWTRKSIKGRPHDLDRQPVLSALLDLERMSSGAVPIEAPAVPAIDEPLLALEQRWQEAIKTFNEATPESPPKPSPDDMTAAISDAQEEMAVTPARTIAGVLIKLRLYTSLNGRAFRTNLDDVQGIGPVVSIDQLPLDSLELDETAVVSVMRDLERLAHTTPVAETPPAEDAALFEALAEYNRLAVISHDLEHRSDILRSGTPEAADASEAFQTAYKKTMKAWETARDTPAATQAGLFAKLQGMVQFVDELSIDELYEAEWNTIKADVRRIVREARS